MNIGIVTARFERTIEDCWVGVYWRSQWQSRPFLRKGSREGTVTDIWICLIPCFPIHITRWVENGLEHA